MKKYTFLFLVFGFILKFFSVNAAEMDIDSKTLVVNLDTLRNWKYLTVAQKAAIDYCIKAEKILKFVHEDGKSITYCSYVYTRDFTLPYELLSIYTDSYDVFDHHFYTNYYTNFKFKINKTAVGNSAWGQLRPAQINALAPYESIYFEVTKPKFAFLYNSELLYQNSLGGLNPSNVDTVYVGTQVTIGAHECHPADKDSVFKGWNVFPKDLEYKTIRRVLQFTMPYRSVAIYPEYGVVRNIGVIDGNASHDKAFMGDTVNLQTFPQKEGLVFDHWQIVSGGGLLKKATDLNASIIMPASDVVVKAVYRADSTFVDVLDVDFTRSQDGSGKINMTKEKFVAIKYAMHKGLFEKNVRTVGGKVILTLTYNSKVYYIITFRDSPMGLCYDEIISASTNVDLTADDNLMVVVGTGTAFDKLTEDEQSVLFKRYESASFIFPLKEPYHSIKVFGGVANRETAIAGDTIMLQATCIKDSTVKFSRWNQHSSKYEYHDSYIVDDKNPNTFFIMPDYDVEIVARYSTDQKYTVDLSKLDGNNGAGFFSDTALAVISYVLATNAIMSVEKGTLTTGGFDVYSVNGKPLFAMKLSCGLDSARSENVLAVLPAYSDEDSSVYKVSLDHFFSLSPSTREKISQENYNIATSYSSIVFTNQPVVPKYPVYVTGGYADVDFAKAGDTVMVYADKLAEGFDFAGWSSNIVEFDNQTCDSTYFIMRSDTVYVSAAFSFETGLESVPKDYMGFYVDGNRILNQTGRSFYVINILGQVVYVGNDREITLERGAYSILADDKIIKVMIK